jgi:transcriptional regulator with XRE-family HTH domain
MKKVTKPKKVMLEASAQPFDIDALLKEIPDTPETRAIAEEEKIKLRLAVALTKVRESVNLTQASLAKKLGVRQSLISKWERVDHNHTLNTLLSLIRTLNANLVLGIEFDGNFLPITEAADRCVLNSPNRMQDESERLHHSVEKNLLPGNLDRVAHTHISSAQEMPYQPANNITRLPSRYTPSTEPLKRAAVAGL